MPNVWAPIVEKCFAHASRADIGRHSGGRRLPTHQPTPDVLRGPLPHAASWAPGEGEAVLPRDESNLVCKGVQVAFDAAGVKVRFLQPPMPVTVA